MIASVVIGTLAASGVARGADSAQAEALIRQGVELRQQGRDAPALPLFQKAYDLVATPRTAGQLGCGEMALGYWLDAEQHLGEALASTEDPWVSKNRKTLDDALTRVRSNIGEVAISGTPAGAKVTVNRHSVGILPLARPIRVAKGKVDIELAAPGFVPMTSSTQVEGGARLILAANLVKVAAAASPVAATLPPRLPAEIVSKARDDEADGGGSLRQKIGWGLGVTAGAVLVGAVVETFLWQQKRSQFNDRADCFEDAANRGAAGCSALFDSSRQAEVVSIIGYASAALLGGGAALLLLTGDTPDRRGTRAKGGSAGIAWNLGCVPGWGTDVLRCRFSF